MTKNQIVNYYVTGIGGNGMPQVFRSPVTINSDVAKELLDKQLATNKKKVSPDKLFHVCYDVDSQIAYLPNATQFTPEKRKILLQAAEIRIAHDFGAISNKKPIDGSPFSTIRVRTINSFELVEKTLQEAYGNNFVNLTVVEANFDKMPTFVKSMESHFSHGLFEGDYISPSKHRTITFYDEIDNDGKRRPQPVPLTTVQAPFIILNIASSAKATTASKERVLVLGYRDFIHDPSIRHPAPSEIEQHKASSSADIYAIKRFLYQGYPFEEVCEVFLPLAKNFKTLYNGIRLISMASDELVKEGYKNPAATPYYITFKIDLETFPFDFSGLIGNEGKINHNKQLPGFQVVEYDKQNQYIIIETPAYINPSLCVSILKAKTTPFITRYNSAQRQIDVKSGEDSFAHIKSSTQQAGKIKSLTQYQLSRENPEEDTKNLSFVSNARSRSISKSTTAMCHVRHVSDYLYAYDHILEMCKNRNMEFVDIPIIVGPIERIFGRGVQGGFMSKKAFDKSKLKTPYEIEPGLMVSPPLISVNSESMTGYEAQTETIIHEYSHNLYSTSHPDHETEYNKPENQKLKEKDKNKWWWLYLNDPDEILAHTVEIEFELKSGKSRDEIIRDKVGGRVDASNYAIALKYAEMVDGIIENMKKKAIPSKTPSVGIQEQNVK